MPLSPEVADALKKILEEEEPRAGFNATFAPLLGGANRNLADYLRGQFSNYHGEFLGRLLSDPSPSLDWADFLGTKDPAADFGRLSPRARGERPGVFAPQVKWLGGF